MELDFFPSNIFIFIIDETIKIPSCDNIILFDF